MVPMATPLPDGADGNGQSGKTWGQMSVKEKATIRRAGEAKKGTVGNPGPDGSGTSSASGTRPKHIKGTLKERANPVINPSPEGSGSKKGPTTASTEPKVGKPDRGGSLVNPGSPEGPQGNNMGATSGNPKGGPSTSGGSTFH